MPTLQGLSCLENFGGKRFRYAGPINDGSGYSGINCVFALYWPRGRVHCRWVTEEKYAQKRVSMVGGGILTINIKQKSSGKKNLYEMSREKFLSAYHE